MKNLMKEILLTNSQTHFFNFYESKGHISIFMTLLEYSTTIHYEYNNSIDKFQYFRVFNWQGEN